MTISTPSEAPPLEALPEESTRQYSANEDLPPFRLNATRVPERLSGSVPPVQHHHMRRRSGEWPRGRSCSPSMKDGENSSISSLDSSDILTDRMGFEDFDIQRQKSLADISVSSLQPVQERLSDDTLEDVHAFSDVTRTTGSVSSRANSTTGGDVGSVLLETLDECDDEEDGAVHISNMKEIDEEESIGAPNLDDLPSEEKAYFYTDEDVPPLRLHACRVPDRLAMSHSSFFSSTTSMPSPVPSPLPPSNRRRAPPIAENASPMLKKGADNTSILAGMGDLDILTDRMAFQELDMDRQKIDGASFSSLQPVNERLSDDTLEDCHAFSDLRSGSVASSARSGANSITTGGDAASILETLDEEDENDDDEDAGAVHISNLENLDIEEDHAAAEQSKPSDVSHAASSEQAAPMLRKGADQNSSFTDIGDSDILTDRMAFQDLDMERQKMDGSSHSSLQPVNERMSDEMLEDCRAFSDIRSGSVASSARSGANSITTGGDAASILETLDEEDEDDDEEDAGAVHISNLENLDIEDDHAAAEKSKPSDFSQAATAGTS